MRGCAWPGVSVFTGLRLAACGLLSPILAALIHVGSETTFILNSARLIPGPSTTPPTR